MSGRAPFGEAEYRLRLQKAREHMIERGVVALIVDECELLHWFTGYAVTENRYRAAVIPRDGDPFMVLRHLDVGPFQAAAWFADHRGFDDTEDPVETLVEEIRCRTLADGPIGLDLNSYCMPAKRFLALQSLLPEVEWVDFSDVLRCLRLRKSPAEIDLLRRAGAVADGAMADTITSVAAGTSPRDAAAVAAGAFLRRGADTGRTGPITAARGWNFLHAALGDAPLGPGDLLHLELVPKVHGYCAKLMRPVIIGPADAVHREAARILIELQDAQIASMKSGARAGDVDSIMRDGLLDAGLRDEYPNNTGYTLGYIFEQGPRSSDFTRVFTAGAQWRLENDMVFHMYTSAKGLAFSETVRVTPDGGERLTLLERTLFSR
jgi:Xaa-Pro dipeptidase